MGIRFVLSIDCGQTIFGTMAEEALVTTRNSLLSTAARCCTRPSSLQDATPWPWPCMGRTAGLLLKAPSYTSDAIFSPNMRWIAYGSRQSGSPRDLCHSLPSPHTLCVSPCFGRGLKQGVGYWSLNGTMDFRVAVNSGYAPYCKR